MPSKLFPVPCPSCSKPRMVSKGREGTLCIGCHCRKMNDDRYPKDRQYAKRDPLNRLRYSMIQRCENKNSKWFHCYGGRGIKVCTEWRTEPYAFIAWANANGYRKGLQIDRIDNNGNYEPNNCRWVTPAVNTQNSRKAKLRTEEIPAIMGLIRGGFSNVFIGKLHGVDARTISGIRNGITWANVTGVVPCAA